MLARNDRLSSVKLWQLSSRSATATVKCCKRRRTPSVSNLRWQHPLSNGKATKRRNAENRWLYGKISGVTKRGHHPRGWHPTESLNIFAAELTNLQEHFLRTMTKKERSSLFEVKMGDTISYRTVCQQL